jgi:tetratricopeptide (TPR) repeat protein
MTANLVAVLLAVSTVTCAAQALAPSRVELEEMYNSAYRAVDAGRFPEALKQLDAIDARRPDLAASKNLRGVIFMRQGNYDEAEVALTDAARIDPKFWNARFNLAEIPFLKRHWAEARKRFEQLLSTGQPDLPKEASQLIQYYILLTYLMEGKSNMVDSILAKLELSRETPALDYAKAAVALQQKNKGEAKDWISAAEKNCSPQLNKLFAESLYEVGWLEKPAGGVTVPVPEARLRQALINHLAKIGFTLVTSDNHTLLFARSGTLHRSPDNPQIIERLLYVTAQRSNNTTFVKGKAELSIQGEATTAVPSQYAEKFALEAGNQ